MNTLRVTIRYNNKEMDGAIHYFKDWYDFYKWFVNLDLLTWKIILKYIIIEDWKNYKRYQWNVNQFSKLYIKCLQKFKKIK